MEELFGKDNLNFTRRLKQFLEEEEEEILTFEKS